MATWRLVVFFVSSALYVVFLRSYMCLPRPPQAWHTIQTQLQGSGCYDFFLVATFLPTLDQLLTVIKTYFQSAEGESLITIERFHAIFVSASATLNATE